MLAENFSFMGPVEGIPDGLSRAAYLEAVNLGVLEKLLREIS